MIVALTGLFSYHFCVYVKSDLFLLSTGRNFASVATQNVPSEDSDQISRTHRVTCSHLRWVHVSESTFSEY